MADNELKKLISRHTDAVTNMKYWLDREIHLTESLQEAKKGINLAYKELDECRKLIENHTRN